MQCPCQQNFVFILTSEKEKPVPKYHILKRFWLWFWYVSLLLFNPFSCQLVPKCHTHLSKPGTFSCRFKYICPFITTRHERVKTCSNMIFNALRILLMVLWSESRNGPVSNILNPVVPLFALDHMSSFEIIYTGIDDLQFVLYYFYVRSQIL